MDIQECKEQFESHFGRPAEAAFRAPGRVNLIGEHTDYNDGYVLPMAIERETVALVAPREDNIVRVVSNQQDEPAEFSLDAVAPGTPPWTNYCRGVAAGIVERDLAPGGCDILLASSVPLGGGLSSSASLEVATALAILRTAEKKIDGMDLARLCQEAEHEYAGMPCGIMDQAISILGKRGSALLLDCRAGDTALIPFDNPDLVLLVCNTNVKHSLADGEYAKRRETCHEAAAKMGVDSLRDADCQQVQTAAAGGLLDGNHLKRARHVTGEIDRTLKAVDALNNADYPQFGELMYGSHASLRDDYAVSCVELDEVVDIASRSEGVFGARMTGGGFGGCAIVLVKSRCVEAVTEAIATGYRDKFNRACTLFSTVAADGAGELAL